MPSSPYLIVNTFTVPNLSVAVDDAGNFSYFNRVEGRWRQVGDQASINEIKAAMPNALWVPSGGPSEPSPVGSPITVGSPIDRMEAVPSSRQPTPAAPVDFAPTAPPPRRNATRSTRTHKPLTDPGAASSSSTHQPARTKQKLDGHVKRPQNAFILFRSANIEAIRAEVGVKGQRISERAGEMWKNAPAHVRATFEQQAHEEKEKHRQLYPDYKFTPKRDWTKSSTSRK